MHGLWCWVFRKSNIANLRTTIIMVKSRVSSYKFMNEIPTQGNEPCAKCCSITHVRFYIHKLFGLKKFVVYCCMDTFPIQML